MGLVLVLLLEGELVLAVLGHQKRRIWLVSRWTFEALVCLQQAYPVVHRLSLLCEGIARVDQDPEMRSAPRVPHLSLHSTWKPADGGSARRWIFSHRPRLAPMIVAAVAAAVDLLSAV